MAVAGQGSEMLRSHPFRGHGPQNPLQALPHTRCSACGQVLLMLGNGRHQGLSASKPTCSRIIQLVHAIA